MSYNLVRTYTANKASDVTVEKDSYKTIEQAKKAMLKAYNNDLHPSNLKRGEEVVEDECFIKDENAFVLIKTNNRYGKGYSTIEYEIEETSGSSKHLTEKVVEDTDEYQIVEYPVELDMKIMDDTIENYEVDGAHAKKVYYGFRKDDPEEPSPFVGWKLDNGKYYVVGVNLDHYADSYKDMVASIVDGLGIEL